MLYNSYQLGASITGSLAQETGPVIKWVKFICKKQFQRHCLLTSSTVAT